jgi:uroporphyrinogen-III synthase
MAYLFDDFQKFGKEQLEVVTASSSSLAESWLAMMDSDTEWQIGETMAEVLRERLVELETLEATDGATEDTVGRLAFVRKLLIRFDARDTSTAERPA